MYSFKGFTQKANTALNLAIEGACELGHTYIGTEHILLGLIRESTGVAAVVLSECGLNEDSFVITSKDIQDKLSISDIRHFEYSLIYLSSISFDYKVHSSWYACNILTSYKHFKGYFKVVLMTSSSTC